MSPGRREPRTLARLLLLAAALLVPFLPATASAFIPAEPADHVAHLRADAELSENSRLGFDDRKPRLSLAARGPQVEARPGYTWDVAWESRLTTDDFRNRWYSPELGRMLSADPTGLRDGPNVYSFAGADPLNYGDPMGTARFKAQWRASL